MFYKLAFSVSVKAPKGFQISFEKHRNFLRWLRSKGFNIKGISSDTYLAGPVHQQLKADGFTVSTISVDRLQKLDKVGGERVEDGSAVTRQICIPYQYFKSTLYEGRLTIYDKCDLLTEEVIGLEKESDGHINHPDNGRSGSKDQCDAMVGALYGASLHAEEFAFDYGESAETTLRINSDSGDFALEMNKAFEEELKNMRPQFKPTHPSNIIEKRTDYNLHPDIIIL